MGGELKGRGSGFSMLEKDKHIPYKSVMMPLHEVGVVWQSDNKRRQELEEAEHQKIRQFKILSEYV
jgi:hypothetical protein